MKIHRIGRLIFIIITLGIFSIIFEDAALRVPFLGPVGHALDFVIFFLFIFAFLARLSRTRNKIKFIKRSIFGIILITVLFLSFMYAKYFYFFVGSHPWHKIPVSIFLVAILFIALNAFLHMDKLRAFFRYFSIRPARTIFLSFIIVILAGTVLLMMPFSASYQVRVGFIDALFTATSAMCVTGLVIGNTATMFSGFGKLVIMLLIQTGGLGIMILAVFVAFRVGRKLTSQDKIAMSHMLDDTGMKNLAQRVRNIISFTVFFEACGALFLFAPFKESVGGSMKAAFFAVFHSISAFCNAGFALFSDNLEQFSSSVPVNLTVAGLIIAGGISFIVISDLFGNLKARAKRRFFQGKQKPSGLTLNTKIVLAVTIILLVSGTLLIYAFEYDSNLRSLDIKTGCLEAFFQTVTLRTAGFNTMDISGLQGATYCLMILFMFIGGAAGSTAGGIKVNTVGVLWAHIRSIFANRDEVVLMKHSIPKSMISQAFLVVFLSLGALFIGVLILALIEQREVIKVVFEAVSAFGTVGLSTGITPQLAGVSKIVIILLMIIGRLGPLTLIAILSGKAERSRLEYPVGKVNIG